jgi:hypothetical protein
LALVAAQSLALVAAQSLALVAAQSLALVAAHSCSSRSIFSYNEWATCCIACHRKIDQNLGRLVVWD